MAVEFKQPALTEGRTGIQSLALAPRVRGTTALLGVLAFWGGMFAAVERYPSEYDWRYITISSLVYGDRNPGGYLWARAGLALCGLAGLYWMTTLTRKLRQLGAPVRPAWIWVLGVGYLSMLSCALLPDGLVPSSRAHDLLALVAFVGVCAGLVGATLSVVERSPRPKPLVGSRRLYARILSGVPLSPIVLAALAQAYVSRVLPGLPWVGLVWRARGVPVYLSFAFWEWVTCVVFSIYMVVLSRSTLAACR